MNIIKCFVIKNAHNDYYIGGQGGFSGHSALSAQVFTRLHEAETKIHMLMEERMPKRKEDVLIIETIHKRLDMTIVEQDDKGENTLGWAG